MLYGVQTDVFYILFRRAFYNCHIHACCN